MTLESCASFEQKLTCGSKNDIKKLAKIFTKAYESLKIGTFIESFYKKYKMYEFKICRGVMCHNN